jgi:hypothetical protein
MLSVICKPCMLSDVMLNVVMLSVIMLHVIAPNLHLKISCNVKPFNSFEHVQPSLIWESENLTVLHSVETITRLG